MAQSNAIRGRPGRPPSPPEGRPAESSRHPRRRPRAQYAQTGQAGATGLQQRAWAVPPASAHHRSEQTGTTQCQAAHADTSRINTFMQCGIKSRGKSRALVIGLVRTASYQQYYVLLTTLLIGASYRQQLWNYLIKIINLDTNSIRHCCYYPYTYIDYSYPPFKLPPATLMTAHMELNAYFHKI